MFPIAGQTARPIGLKFVDTQGWPGYRLKNPKKKNFEIFFSTGNAGPFS